MTAQRPNIGYVGVGLMGLPMVTRLCALGYRVRAYDIVTAQNDKARAAGATIATSPADATRGAPFILLNLPTSEAVESAAFGVEGIVHALAPPQLVVDFSTVKVDKGRAFAVRLREATGCGWVDAPVSGGPPASGSGTLTVMAGGAPDDLARIAPLMKDLASRFTAMGPSGAGLVAKMINQLIVGCTHAVMAEALLVAEAAGIDAARAFIVREFSPLLDEIRRNGVGGQDYKSALQELLQSRDMPLPEYRLVGTHGPDHRKEFQVAVIVRADVLGEASGPSKKTTPSDRGPRIAHATPGCASRNTNSR